MGFGDDISGMHSKVTQDNSNISKLVEKKLDEAFADTESHTFETFLSSCAGFVAEIFKGASSTVTLGVPMAVAHSDEERFAEQCEE